jgi:FkbM family methyltransferase
MYAPYKNAKSHPYKKKHCFEKKESLNIMAALKYYSQKSQTIDNKNIFMLDIGGNIGWYPSLLGRFGYTILTFEPNYDNYYINRKNFCYINRNSNVIIITKGLNNEEKICDYYRHGHTNGMTICYTNTTNNTEKVLPHGFVKESTVVLTKLSYFIPYLSDKNVALIKIDIEGSEGIVIENGIDLITKHHVPFIFLEFSPSFLKEHKTDPKNFIQLFLNNGYKISLKSFLSKEYISLDYLLKIVRFQKNIYLIYTDFLI